jgi:2-dehydropantoate 2-reductase
MADHNIAIIGAGPIGSIMAAYLARNKENVFLIDIKKELISAIQNKGIIITGMGDNFTVPVKGTGYSAASLSQFDVDLIFIAVKSNYLDSLIEEIKPIFKVGQKILLIQNGIDNEDRAAEKLSKVDILRFVINYGGMIEKPGVFKMSFFNPPNYIGVLSSENEPLAKKIADFITQAGLETQFSPDIKRNEWKKTILNASLMPVCATKDMTMKEAMPRKWGTNSEKIFLKKVCPTYPMLATTSPRHPSTSKQEIRSNTFFSPSSITGKKPVSPLPISNR